MKSQGILVVTAGIVIMLCLGAAYSWGVFVKPIGTDLGWTRSNILLAVSILLLTFSAFMPISGLLQKKIGPYWMVTFAGFLISLAWIGTSFAKSLVELYIFYGLIGGIGTGINYNSAISTGPKFYPQKKGLILGMIVFGFGLGSAIISPLMTYLINSVGWRLTMRYFGLAFGFIIILAAQFLRFSKNNFEFIPEKNKLKQKNMEKSSYSFNHLLKSSPFWILFISYFLAMIAGMMILAHVVAFSVDQGLSSVQGALALSVLAFFNGLGRILAGYLSDKFDSKLVLIILLLLISIGMFFFAWVHNHYLLYILSGIIGLCFGGFLAVYPLLTAKIFGNSHFSINYGLVFIGYGSGCFAGPLIAGWVYDIWKNYTIAFYSASALTLVASVIVLFFLKSCQIKQGCPSIDQAVISNYNRY